MKYKIICGFVMMFAAGGCTQLSNEKVSAEYVKDKDFMVIKNGRAYAEIIIPKQAPDVIRNSAVLLSEYILKSSGVKINISEEDVIDPDMAHIFLGDTHFFKDRKIDISHLNEQGFIIAFPDERSMIIAGQTDDAVEFGVYEFLERFLGVRWLFPGELGDFVPENETIVLKQKTFEQQPALLSRVLSGISSKDGKTWAQRNRMRGTLAFHHNLGKLFLPEKYTKTHPHFYPVINGQRQVPKTLVGWQPCFTAEGSVEEAAKNIIDLFKRYPSRTSVSLGVNDNSGFCECDNCRALDGEKINSVGNPSRSECYYRWCNAVVEKVLSQFPDKDFGLLAYGDIIDPPEKMKLNSHIVPYICFDRMQWLNKELEKEGKKLNDKWAEKVNMLGWYDYIYGCKYYIVPRVYFHQMAENLLYGYRHKLRHYYAEAYPTEAWREGPKLYILLKLLWNPEQNVDELLEEWCEAAVGKKAAGSLLAYFSLWEKFWTERIPESKWFQKNCHGTFLPFRGYGYLEELTAGDIRTAEKLLKKTLNAAGTEKEKLRAQFFLDSFLKTKLQINEYIDFLTLNDSANIYKTKQIIENSNFNRSMEGWGAWQRTYSKARLTYDRKEGHNTPGCLKFNTEKSVKSPLVFSKNMPITEGKLYRLSAWVKHRGLLEESDIKLKLQWKDKDDKWFVNRKKGNDIRPLNISADTSSGEDVWRKTQIVFRGPSGGAVYAVCMLVVEGTDTGTVYFDDVIFEELIK